MNTTTSMRLRALRFLSERYMQRECPSYFAEFFLFALVFITMTWPIFSLAHAMAQGTWIGTLMRVWF
jgi:hypothetical protein